MRGGTLDAVPVVDAALARLVVDIEVLEVVVKVDTARTEVSTEKGSVGGEDGSHINVSLPAEGDGETGLPLVEVGDDGLVGLSGGELKSAESKNDTQCH